MHIRNSTTNDYRGLFSRPLMMWYVRCEYLLQNNKTKRRIKHYIQYINIYMPSLGKLLMSNSLRCGGWLHDLVWSSHPNQDCAVRLNGSCVRKVQFNTHHRTKDPFSLIAPLSQCKAVQKPQNALRNYIMQIIANKLRVVLLNDWPNCMGII